MSLYAIGDLHLSYQVPNKKMDKFGKVWHDHEEKFVENCRKMVSDEDTLVLVGDHTWGRKMSECEEDFKYIMSLPGKKILTRGNHDMFWDSHKTDKLNEQFAGKLQFLQGNFFPYGEYALVATKGYTFEGPFYLDSRGRIIDWDEKEAAKAEKLVEREYKRLVEAFEKAAEAGYKKYIMFLHYPPTNVLQKESCFTRLADQYKVEQVIYAHCHGEARYDDSIKGDFHGIKYSLVSGDYLKWKPQLIIQ